MKSSYVREQKRYTQKAISQLFSLNAEETIKFIRKLKAYGVLKTVKATSQEKNLTDLTDDEIEIVNEEDISTDYYYVFVFVGVVTVGNIIIKCYPKYISSNEEPLNEMKQVLKVISKYNSKEQIINLFNGEVEQSTFNLLATVLYLYNDYNENGIYTNHQEIIETNGEGEILWDKTINETFVFLSNNRPFYTELQTQITVDDETDYFRRLHECVLSECSRRLRGASLLELFDLEEINLYEGELLDFGDNDYILYRLQKELNVQFVTRKQDLLKTMYAYIAHSKIIDQGFGLSMYGTNSYNLVWEKVCAEVMGNVLNTKISKLPKPIASSYANRKDKSLSELIQKPVWRSFDVNGKYIEHLADKTLTPDLITIYKMGEGYCFGIFDAKYYNIQLNEKGVFSHPGVSDVTKQYLYQLAYQDFISTHGYDYVQNAFLFPCEGNVIKVLGQAEMTILYDLKEEQLENISVVKLPAHKMYNLYLANKQLKDLENELVELPIAKSGNGTFSNRLREYLAKSVCINVRVSKEVEHIYQNGIIEYPTVLKCEVGAKIIYDILFKFASKCYYAFSLQQVSRIDTVAENNILTDEATLQLARVALTLEKEIKKMDDSTKLNINIISEVVKTLLRKEESFIGLSEGKFFDELLLDVIELIQKLYC